MRRAAFVLALAALVSGCGVRPTGLISGGDPAVARQVVPPTTIYLVRQGRLFAVHRAAIPGAPQAVADVLARGLTAPEYGQGLSDPVEFLSNVHANFHDGELAFSYEDDTPPAELTLAVIACSCEAQPGVRKVKIIRNGADVEPAACASYRQYAAN